MASGEFGQWALLEWWNWLLGGGAANMSPATLYVSLHTADPLDTGANEIDGGVETWYARQAITFQPASGRSITQDAGAVVFPSKSTAGNITVTHIGLWTSLAGADEMWFGDVTDIVIAQNKAPAVKDIVITIPTGMITTAHATELLDSWFDNNLMTDPGNTGWVALFTANPTDSGSVANEVAAGVGYSRQAGAWSGAGSPTARSKTSNALITFGPASGAGFGTVTHFGICKGSTRGVADVMYYGALDASENVQAGLNLNILSTDLELTL